MQSDVPPPIHRNRHIVDLIHNLPEIGQYPLLMAQTHRDHSMRDAIERDSSLVAKLLRKARRVSDRDNAIELLREEGELRGLKMLRETDGFDLNADYARWQKENDAQWARAEERVDACDYLEIPDTEFENWS